MSLDNMDRSFLHLPCVQALCLDTSVFLVFKQSTFICACLNASSSLKITDAWILQQSYIQKVGSLLGGYSHI